MTQYGGPIVQGSAGVRIGAGKPAARQGDMTQYGGPIVQGPLLGGIGAPTGVACSVCPGGMTSGNPVNPLLGA
ncbi:PAAR domain-containing protein, partial [Escherichia coli]|uniref:PAAR domain-containing protein n=1 Tax=Escherichia coli TaxID=562 RepID=UPI003F51EC88